MMKASVFARVFRPLIFALCCLLTITVYARQDVPPQDTPADMQDEEIITISADLIQAGVMVFDKQGRFVDKLKPEDFEVRVEDRPVTLSFFERVGGSPASGRAERDRKPGPEAASAAGGGQRGRTILFFVDDMHLSHESHKRARDLIRHFVNNEMGPDDVAAIISPSGRIGFLQQFTDQSEVLLAATERLKFSRDMSSTDHQPPPMTEYEAALIDRYDPEVTRVFVSLYISMGLATKAEDAEMQVRSRARTVLQRASYITKRTYATLEQALRRTTVIPGRKIVFFISDGFFLDPQNTDSSYRIRRITDAAARANAVIHTLDIKGITADMPSGTAGTFRTRSGELWEQQDPLSSFAENTGGRFIRNTNDPRPGVAKAVAESSAYYLLAWRPEQGDGGVGKFRRITVRVKGRTDLTVRVQSGFLDAVKEQDDKRSSEAKKDASAPASDPLREALGSQVPLRALPTSLVVNSLDMPGEGPILMAAVRVSGDALAFITDGDKVSAGVEIFGVVFDSQGKQQGGFRERVTLTGAASSTDAAASRDLFYNYQVKVKPGIYQVRVAARDEKGGLVGSTAGWVEVADTSARRLVLSSLMVGERVPDLNAHAAGGPAENVRSAEASLSVDRRFERGSVLRYLLYIYNAGRGRSAGAPPNVVIKTRIRRDGRVVLDGPESSVTIEGQDPARLAYAAEIPLERLTPGRYVLEVTASDRIAKADQSRRVTFEIK